MNSENYNERQRFILMKNVKRVRQENLAKVFDALGHYRRINIFTHILSYGETGISFGALGELVNLTPSTLSHHVSKMHKGGIISKKQAGTMTILTANISILQTSIGNLTGG